MHDSIWRAWQTRDWVKGRLIGQGWLESSVSLDLRLMVFDQAGHRQDPWSLSVLRHPDSEVSCSVLLWTRTRPRLVLTELLPELLLYHELASCLQDDKLDSLIDQAAELFHEIQILNRNTILNPAVCTDV